MEFLYHFLKFDSLNNGERNQYLINETGTNYQYDNINLQLNDNFIKILTKRYLFKNVCVGGGDYILICVECFALKFIVNLAFPCERRFNDVPCVFNSARSKPLSL